MIDLAGAHFTSAIDFTFRAMPRSLRVVILSWPPMPSIADRYGFPSSSEFSSNLKNSGERVVLVNAFGRPLIDFAYSDEGAWDSAADRAGSSLVLPRPDDSE